MMITRREASQLLQQYEPLLKNIQHYLEAKLKEALSKINPAVTPFYFILLNVVPYENILKIINDILNTLPKIATENEWLNLKSLYDQQLILHNAILNASFNMLCDIEQINGALLKQFGACILKKYAISIYKKDNRTLGIRFPDADWRTIFLKLLGGIKKFRPDFLYASHREQVFPIIDEMNPSLLYINILEKIGRKLTLPIPDYETLLKMTDLLRCADGNSFSFLSFNNTNLIYFDEIPIHSKKNDHFNISASQELLTELFNTHCTHTLHTIYLAVFLIRQGMRTSVTSKGRSYFSLLPLELGLKIAANITEAKWLEEEDKIEMASLYSRQLTITLNKLGLFNLKKNELSTLIDKKNHSLNKYSL